VVYTELLFMAQSVWRLGYGLDDRGSIPIRGKKVFLSIVSRPALGSIQPPNQWTPGALSPRVMRQGSETDHSPPSSAKVKNGGVLPPLQHITSWVGD
jgi:hypothetical protein